VVEVVGSEEDNHTGHSSFVQSGPSVRELPAPKWPIKLLTNYIGVDYQANLKPVFQEGSERRNL